MTRQILIVALTLRGPRPRVSYAAETFHRQWASRRRNCGSPYATFRTEPSGIASLPLPCLLLCPLQLNNRLQVLPLFASADTTTPHLHSPRQPPNKTNHKNKTTPHQPAEGVVMQPLHQKVRLLPPIRRQPRDQLVRVGFRREFHDVPRVFRDEPHGISNPTHLRKLDQRGNLSNTIIADLVTTLQLFRT